MWPQGARRWSACFMPYLWQSPIYNLQMDIKEQEHTRIWSKLIFNKSSGQNLCFLPSHCVPFQTWTARCRAPCEFSVCWELESFQGQDTVTCLMTCSMKLVSRSMYSGLLIDGGETWSQWWWPMTSSWPWPVLPGPLCKLGLRKKAFDSFRASSESSSDYCIEFLWGPLK